MAQKIKIVNLLFLLLSLPALDDKSIAMRAESGEKNAYHEAMLEVSAPYCAQVYWFTKAKEANVGIAVDPPTGFDLAFYFDGDDCQNGAIFGYDDDAEVFYSLGRKKWDDLLGLRKLPDQKPIHGILPVSRELEGMAFLVKMRNNSYTVVRFTEVIPSSWEKLRAGGKARVRFEWRLFELGKGVQDVVRSGVGGVTESPFYQGWVASPVPVRIKSDTFYLGKVEHEGQQYLTAKTADGRIVQDAATLKKIFLVQHVYRFTFTKPIKSLRVQQLDWSIGELQTTLNMSYLSDAVLFLRDVSARALCEAILAAASGGTSVGKTIAEAAAISAAKAFVKDPVTYAKGVNYLTIQSALDALQRARKNIANDTRTGNFSYEKAKAIERYLVFGLSRSNTSQVLQGQLYLTSGGSGDLASQLQKVGATMLDQLIGKIKDTFKYKELIDEALLGAKIVDFVVENCPAYAKYVGDTQEAEKLFRYETSFYYRDVVEPTIKHWCDTDEKRTDIALSSPEEALKRWYEGVVQLHWPTLVRAVSSDGEFDRWKDKSEADWEKEISKINAEGGDVFSDLLKVVFVKKGVYRGHEAIAVKDYYPKELDVHRLPSSASACFETCRGELVDQLDDSVCYVIAPHIFTFKKEDGEWKVHMEYGQCLTPLNPKPIDKLYFVEMKNETPLNYTFWPKPITYQMAPKHLVGKFPALDSWNNLVMALRQGYWEEAARYLCDGLGGGNYVSVDYASVKKVSELDDFFRTRELAFVCSDIPIEFREVEEEADSTFIILVDWSLSDSGRLGMIKFYKELRDSSEPEVQALARRMIEKLAGISDEEFSSIELPEGVKRLKFHFVEGMWKLLPDGW